MKTAKPLVAALLLGAALLLPLRALGQQVSVYRGICDASAALALDAKFFVVADDERNVLLVYQYGRPDAVVSLPLWKFLDTKPTKESDIEGAAALGNRIYWIASHGRNSKGQEREDRHRLFANEIVPGSGPFLKPVGKPYRRLLDDLISAEALKPYRLEQASKLAPEAPGGLNIEGLAAGPAGELLIGFRNPVTAGRALVVPLENPGEVIKGARAKLGAPHELDLGGRGVRSIERVGTGYLIVAGPPADGGSFALYRWSGRAGEGAQALTGIMLGTLRPEALFALPGTTSVQLLSDDGGVEVNGVDCKDRPAAVQSFRSVTLQP